MAANEKTLKILSIDGGGIKGLIALYMLKDIENMYCVPNNKLISDYFDMICGTSTGGFITLCLTTGMSVDDIINIYTQNLDILFPTYSKYALIKFFKNSYRSIRQLLGYKYSNQPLLNIVTNVAQDKKLSDVKNLICIPSYNLTQNTIKITKNSKNTDDNLPLIAVAMGTSAAPTYFPSYEIDNDYYIDGGIYANNPSLVGIVEALRHYVGPNKPYSNYSLLSLGNINYIEKKDPNTSNNMFKNLFWNFTNIPYFIDVLFNANSIATERMCRFLSNYTQSTYVRLELNPTNGSPITSISMDDSDPANVQLMETVTRNYITDILSESSPNYNPYIKTFFENGNSINEIIF